jgi:hypothetical protein
MKVETTERKMSLKLNVNAWEANPNLGSYIQSRGFVPSVENVIVENFYIPDICLASDAEVSDQEEEIEVIEY